MATSVLPLQAFALDVCLEAGDASAPAGSSDGARVVEDVLDGGADGVRVDA